MTNLIGWKVRIKKCYCRTALGMIVNSNLRCAFFYHFFSHFAHPVLETIVSTFMVGKRGDGFPFVCPLEQLKFFAAFILFPVLKPSTFSSPYVVNHFINSFQMFWEILHIN